MKNSEKFKSMQERSDAFRGFCRSRHCPDCELDPTQDNIECAYTWLDLEAEEEKPLPCPFCGHETILVPCWYVSCDKCHYHSPNEIEKSAVIARHNALCRRLKGGQP